MQPLSAEDVRHIALLTRLELSDSEVEEMRAQLTNILEHFQSLAEVHTTGVEPTGHSTNAHTVTRVDRPSDSLLREQVTSNAPNHDGEFLRVKPILE